VPIGFAHEPHAAQAQTGRAFVEEDAARREQARRHGEQRLRAEPCRPPELGSFDACDVAVAEDARHARDLVHYFARAVRLGPKSELHGAVRSVHLLDEHVAEASRVLDERHGPPNSRRNEARPPIPAEHVLRFAHERLFVEAQDVALQAFAREVARAPFAADGKGRLELDAELVDARREPLTHVELERDEHIVVLAELLAVEKDARDRVEAVEAQDAVRERGVRREREVRLVNPAFRVDPLAAELETPRERIGNDPCRHQIGVHRARDRSVEPLERGIAEPCGRDEPARAGELPAVSKRGATEHTHTVAV
jgi:hypothetical protein